MKKILLLTVFFSLFLIAYPKNLTVSKNKTFDAGEMTLCLPNNQPFTGTVIDGKDREFYKEGKPHGKWLCFYENKKLKSIENWKKGNLHGKYILYSENGKKLLEAYYKNGKMNGKYKVYYENGNPRILGKLKDGIPVGKWKKYSIDGRVTIIKK